MQINMTTFAARKQQYVHDTLRSLFESDWRASNSPVNLIVGSKDESHLEYVGHPMIRIVPRDAETVPSMRLNCTINKIRALQCGDDEETITCQDDVLFLPDWLSSLRLAKAELATTNTFSACTPHSRCWRRPAS